MISIDVPGSPLRPDCPVRPGWPTSPGSPFGPADLCVTQTYVEKQLHRHTNTCTYYPYTLKCKGRKFGLANYWQIKFGKCKCSTFILTNFGLAK